MNIYDLFVNDESAESSNIVQSNLGYAPKEISDSCGDRNIKNISDDNCHTFKNINSPADHIQKNDACGQDQLINKNDFYKIYNYLWRDCNDKIFDNLSNDKWNEIIDDTINISNNHDQQPNKGGNRKQDNSNDSSEVNSENNSTSGMNGDCYDKIKSAEQNSKHFGLCRKRQSIEVINDNKE